MAAGDPREVVARKRDGKEVDSEELRAFVLGYAAGDIPDHLAAAFLMAAYLNGLSIRETSDLTQAMVGSGSVLPLSGIERPKVDKHSTGGVGDGVTLVFAPLAASLGLAVAKLSGRGLGHTGGTLDKLESIPGFRTHLSPEELERQVRDVGCAVAAQSADLVPADGALYALRDATATVGSIPLIAASVMSKKLAVGSNLVLLDVKAGSGAFMKTPEAATDLARTCVALASEWGREARAAVTDMSQPLGHAIGNALEIAQTVRVLRGEEGGRLRDLAALFAVEAFGSLEGAGRGEAEAAVDEALRSGRAAEAFARMVRAQGGDPRVVDEPASVLPEAPVRLDVVSPEDGRLASVDAEALGWAALRLGAGRVRKGEAIDPAVGIEFLPNLGDRLSVGDRVAVIHARDEEAARWVSSLVVESLCVGEDAPEPPPLVHAWIGAEEEG